MEYERVHAAALITEKRGKNFDKVLGEWQSKAADVSAEVAAIQFKWQCQFLQNLLVKNGCLLRVVGSELVNFMVIFVSSFLGTLKINNFNLSPVFTTWVMAINFIC